MAIPKNATELGPRLYLFKSTTNTTDCIISAHGGNFFWNRSFRVPEGIRILFYNEHRTALLDPSTGFFAKKLGDAVPVEVREAGEDCRNYLLTKYQGTPDQKARRVAAETFEQLGAVVGQADRYRNRHIETLTRNIGAADPDTHLIQSAWETLDRSRGGSVLAVRTALLVQSVSLKDAIEAAKKEMPSLRDFHCLFCRVDILLDILGFRAEEQSVRYQPGKDREG